MIYNLSVAIKKIPPDESGEKYVDGLVSTGNKFPYTILITNFSN